LAKTRNTMNRSRQVALAAVFAALYAIAVTVLAPISFQIYQVRVADCLLPLSILFGPPAIIGLTIGTFVGNLSSPFGAVDIIGGAFANLIATLLAWQIGRWSFRGAWVAGTVFEVAVITLIVGTYLSFLLQISMWLSWAGVLVGEVIAVNIAGYPLLIGVHRALGRSQSGHGREALIETPDATTSPRGSS
jgi:uncharacterized membrane protein